MTSTCLYSPYKAIGYVTDGNPFCINYLGDDIFIYTTVRNTFQVYRFDKLVVCLVARPVPTGTIRAMQAIGHRAYVAVDNLIHTYERTVIIDTFKEHNSKIIGLLSIGKILLSYDEENNLKVFETNTKSILNTIKLLQSSKITTMVHPASYVNKVVIGYENGCLELWNIMTKKIIYTFQSITKYFSKQSISSVSSISCLEQSPASDVIAVGCSSGDILLLNLKLDLILFSYKQDGGSVTSLSFRTDIGAEKAPYLVSGSTDGRIHVWNLGQVKELDNSNNDVDDNDDHDDEGRNISKKIMIRRLENTISEAHRNAVSRVYFLHGEPVMISSSSDNSLKVWIFDNSDGSARLLKSRQGHQGPSLHIRYYGAVTNASMRENHDGFSSELLSAGSDGTFRYFNTVIENQNREMSQQPMLKKLGLLRRNERLSNIIDFDSTETRQRDWANLVTIHKDDSHAYLWKYKDRVISERVLRQPKPLTWIQSRKNNSTAVAVSSCGNFVVVGTRGGSIYKYNMQSGLPRGKYPQNTFSDMNPNTYHMKSKLPGNVIHEAIKILNEDDEDNIHPVLKDMAKHQKRSNQKLEGHSNQVTGLFISLTNTIMVSCSLDGQVIFWDFISHNYITNISHNNQILFMRGYRDGNFIAIASQDHIIRIYDLITHKLSRRFVGHNREITDMCFTPDGRRLVSSSVDGSLRTWDMPTGRCLSWILFTSAILSISISLSGEFLCVSQADRDGISMYVDRSLYETIHFWKEPTKPTPITESQIQIETVNDDDEEEEENDEDEDENKGIDYEIDDRNGNLSKRKSQTDSIILEGNEITSGKVKYVESTKQRGEGSITLSAVPKAYWTTLFHLEAIKNRNKGNEATAITVTKPVEAPFFLPTIVREDAVPSFPTPQQYAKLTNSLQSSITSKEDKKRENDDKTESFGKKRSRSESTVSNDEEKIANELAGMTSVWSESNIQEDNEDEMEQKSLVVVHGSKKNDRSMSRILRGDVELPRCKLVAYIKQEYPCIDENHNFMRAKNIIVNDNDDSNDNSSPILSYLKTLSPSAVDVEMRSLCLHDEDEEGLRYIQAMTKMFIHELSIGDNFEVLQAYLHRFLLIFNETLSKLIHSSSDLIELQDSHERASERFRHMLQKNLCLLKVFAKLPTI